MGEVQALINTKKSNKKFDISPDNNQKEGNNTDEYCPGEKIRNEKMQIMRQKTLKIPNNRQKEKIH